MKLTQMKIIKSNCEKKRDQNCLSFPCFMKYVETRNAFFLDLFNSQSVLRIFALNKHFRSNQ